MPQDRQSFSRSSLMMIFEVRHENPNFRIHEASTAEADPGMSTALRSVELLDVLSGTPAGPSVARRLAKRRIHARLRLLATNLHE
jgi:hypothetical protein